jgi:nitrogen regulatory protein PII
MEIRKKIFKLPEKEQQNGLTAPKKLKILITIVDRRKSDFYLDVLEGFEVNMQTVIYGRGTASSDMMHYLGLSQTDKAVIVSVVKEDKIKEITAAYEDKYFKTKNGKGIAFTIPISSLIGVSIYQFLSNSLEGRRGE